MTDTKQQVFASMDNEISHGNLFFGFTEREVAADLLSRDPSLEYTVDEVVPFVKEYCWGPMAAEVERLVSVGDAGGAYAYSTLWVPECREFILSMLKPETRAAVAAQK